LISLRFSTAVDVITDLCSKLLHALTYYSSHTDRMVVIALPIAIVARVHISAPQKVALIGVLSLGLIIIGFAIARIVVTDAQGTHPEISWLSLWSAIESSVAVLVCCLASFKALFTGQRHGSSRQPYYTHSSTRGRGVSSKHGSESHQEHGEVRMSGASSRSRSIPLNGVKGGESRVTREQWIDDSSSEMEIFGEIPRQRGLP